MNRYLIVASAAALLVACGPKPADNTTTTTTVDNTTTTAVDNSTTNPTTTIPADNATANTTAPSAGGPATAADFVTKAASTDMFEIAAAKLARKMATSKDVKDFAAMMIKDHTKSTMALKAAIKDSGQDLAPPAELPPEMQAKLDKLMATDPAGFDKAYMDSQVDAHKTALGVMKGYAAGGDVAQIKAFASVTADTVHMHLDHAKMVDANLK